MTRAWVVLGITGGIAGWSMALRAWWRAARLRATRDRDGWCQRLRSLLESAPGLAQRIDAGHLAWAMWGQAHELFWLEQWDGHWYARAVPTLVQRRAPAGPAEDPVVTAPIAVLHA